MTEPRAYDRRQDVGQKLFIGIVTAILTTVFLATLSLGWQNYERQNKIEVRLVQVEVFVRNQDRLNQKLTNFLESGYYTKYKQGGA